MSYIEREKVLAEYDQQHKGPPGGVRKIIETFPDADVRPVVMCRDCKFTKTDDVEDPAIYCEKWDRWEMPPDGFCWLGKKKKGNQQWKLSL